MYYLQTNYFLRVLERIIVPSFRLLEFRLFQFDHQNCQEFSAKIGNFECIKWNMMTFSLRCLEFDFSYLSINQVFPIIFLEFCISLFLTVDIFEWNDDILHSQTEELSIFNILARYTIHGQLGQEFTSKECLISPKFWLYHSDHNTGKNK